jgi:heme oxygenase
VIHLTTPQAVSLVAGSGGLSATLGAVASNVYKAWKEGRAAERLRAQADEHHDEAHELEMRKVEFAEQMALMDSLRAQLAQQLAVSRQYFEDNQALSLLVREGRAREQDCEARLESYRAAQEKIADLYRRLGLALARSAGHGPPGGGP